MKKVLAMLLLAMPLAVCAQDQPSVTEQAQKAPQSNLKVTETAPTYSDIYCSGFVTKENIPTTNHVVGGLDTPSTTRYGAREYLYLTGPGYAVGNRYSIIRKERDPNRYEMFPGQFALLERSGHPYRDLGHLVITNVEKDVAVGRIEFSCDGITPGDVLIPFHEREMVQYRHRTTPFQRFAPYSGTAGRIIDGQAFNKVLGTGQKVYVNIGANKGVHPGDYLRITRNYAPKDLDPVNALSYMSPLMEDTAYDAPKIPKSEYNKLPYRGIGEMVVLSVTPETATGMISFALEDVQVGDVVELQPAQQ